jgi:hypothetical protein
MAATLGQKTAPGDTELDPPEHVQGELERAHLCSGQHSHTSGCFLSAHLRAGFCSGLKTEAAFGEVKILL